MDSTTRLSTQRVGAIPVVVAGLEKMKLVDYCPKSKQHLPEDKSRVRQDQHEPQQVHAEDSREDRVKVLEARATDQTSAASIEGNSMFLNGNDKLEAYPTLSQRPAGVIPVTCSGSGDSGSSIVRRPDVGWLRGTRSFPVQTQEPTIRRQCCRRGR